MSTGRAGTLHFSRSSPSLAASSNPMFSNPSAGLQSLPNCHERSASSTAPISISPAWSGSGTVLQQMTRTHFDGGISSRSLYQSEAGSLSAPTTGPGNEKLKQHQDQLVQWSQSLFHEVEVLEREKLKLHADLAAAQENLSQCSKMLDQRNMELEHVHQDYHSLELRLANVQKENQIFQEERHRLQSELDQMRHRYLVLEQRSNQELVQLSEARAESQGFQRQLVDSHQLIEQLQRKATPQTTHEAATHSLFGSCKGKPASDTSTHEPATHSSLDSMKSDAGASTLSSQEPHAERKEGHSLRAKRGLSHMLHLEEPQDEEENSSSERQSRMVANGPLQSTGPLHTHMKERMRALSSREDVSKSAHEVGSTKVAEAADNAAKPDAHPHPSTGHTMLGFLHRHHKDKDSAKADQKADEVVRPNTVQHSSMGVAMSGLFHHSKKEAHEADSAKAEHGADDVVRPHTVTHSSTGTTMSGLFHRHKKDLHEAGSASNSNGGGSAAIKEKDSSKATQRADDIARPNTVQHSSMGSSMSGMFHRPRKDTHESTTANTAHGADDAAIKNTAAHHYGMAMLHRHKKDTHEANTESSNGADDAAMKGAHENHHGLASTFPRLSHHIKKEAQVKAAEAP